MPQIVLEHLTVVYGDKKEKVVAIDDLSATFHPSFNVILGASGCGKTTLLRALAGVNRYSGKIFFDGADVSDTPTNERDIALVSQKFLLYPNKTIFDNIAFPLSVQKVPVDEIKKRVFDIAEKLDLVPCLSRKPKQISGGQQQRVAIAKALVKNPSVCLMDEPLSNVDPQSRSKSRALIKKTLKEYGCTVVYVTHNAVEAMALADNLVIMEKGKFVLSGKPYELYNSSDPAADLLKSGLLDEFGTEGV